MRECVDLRRLMVAGDDQAAATMDEEILCDRIDPFRDGRPERLSRLRQSPRPTLSSRITRCA